MVSTSNNPAPFFKKPQYVTFSITFTLINGSIYKWQ